MRTISLAQAVFLSVLFSCGPLHAKEMTPEQVAAEVIASEDAGYMARNGISPREMLKKVMSDPLLAGDPYLAYSRSDRRKYETYIAKGSRNRTPLSGQREYESAKRNFQNRVKSVMNSAKRHEWEAMKFKKADLDLQRQKLNLEARRLNRKVAPKDRRRTSPAADGSGRSKDSWKAFGGSGDDEIPKYEHFKKGDPDIYKGINGGDVEMVQSEVDWTKTPRVEWKGRVVRGPVYFGSDGFVYDADGKNLGVKQNPFIDEKPRDRRYNYVTLPSGETVRYRK